MRRLIIQFVLLTEILFSPYEVNADTTAEPLSSVVTSLPDQHPFEWQHRRVLPELPQATAKHSQHLDSILTWSSTYNLRNRGYIVDAESRELLFKYRRGLTDKLSFTADFGARMVDEGILDSAIHNWHNALGLGGGRRDRRGRNRFEIEAQTDDGRIVTIDRKPFGLTDMRIGSRLSLSESESEDTKLFLASDLTLPTHIETYGQDSVDLHFALLGSTRLDSILLFANIGGAVFGDRHEDGLDFDPGSLEAAAGVLISISQNWSVQLDQIIETTSAKNIERYPDYAIYLDVALQYNFSPAWIGSILVRENPFNGRATTDFTGLLSVTYAWPK